MAEWSRGTLDDLLVKPKPIVHTDCTQRSGDDAGTSPFQGR
jgi:hypothetical protein